MGWMWGLNLHIFTTYRVNYRLIFDLQGTKHDVWSGHLNWLFNGCALFTLLWFAMLTWSLFALKHTECSTIPWISWGHDHIIVFPSVMVLVLLILGAMREFYDGFWFLGLCSRIFRAPFLPVRFVDIYMADQFTSLSIVLVDLHLCTCYIVTGSIANEDATTENICYIQNQSIKPFLAVIPSLVRFLQCLRRYYDSCPSTSDCCSCCHACTSGQMVHMYNAAKYAVAFPIVFFSVLKAQKGDSTWPMIGWVVFAATGALYKYYWDLSHDWGVGDYENGMLRPRRHAANGDPRANEVNHYYPTSIYYTAMVCDFFLRAGWTLTISPGYMDDTILGTILALLEILRRGAIWNPLRLEHEHINNVSKFRATTVSGGRIVDRLRETSTIDEEFFPTQSNRKRKVRSDGPPSLQIQA